MSPEKLAYMANQIARFFATRPEEQAVADTADHIRRFWDPRMRSQILAHLAQGGEGLDPIARAAVTQLKGDPAVATR